MNKFPILVKSFLFLVLLSFGFQNLFSQVNSPNHFEWNTLGSAKQIAYIDVAKLKSDTMQSTSESPILFDWNQKSVERKSFYQDEQMYNTSCLGGSFLRKNVIHYCIPFADLGYHLSTQGGLPHGEFVSMNGYGFDVYYETDKNRFYFFGCCWNYSGGFGPFLGNPKIELPKAIKSRRTKELKLSFETNISQSWLNPKADEEDEIIEKKIPCAQGYCPPTPRELQYRRLNGFITKIRIKNVGDRDLFFVVPKSENILSKSIENKDFYRQGIERKIEPQDGLNWESFPRGKTIELEFESVGQERIDLIYLIHFNDKSTFWDSVEYGINFKSKFRRFKKKS